MIKTILFTGGPCGGKTECIEAIKSIFLNEDLSKTWKVLVSSETPTELMQSGLNPHEMGGKEFNRFVMERQFQKEKWIMGIANQYESEYGKNVLIIFDRGIPDISAYISRDDYMELLKKYYDGTEETFFRYVTYRYDKIVHMSTSARYENKLYDELKNTNSTRYENAEKAILLDTKLIEIYNVPIRDIIPSVNDFNDKIRNALLSVCNLIDDVTPLKIFNAAENIFEEIKDNSEMPMNEFINLLNSASLCALKVSDEDIIICNIGNISVFPSSQVKLFLTQLQKITEKKIVILPKPYIEIKSMGGEKAIEFLEKIINDLKGDQI